jgi:hypothetical protein
LPGAIPFSRLGNPKIVQPVLVELTFRFSKDRQKLTIHLQIITPFCKLPAWEIYDPPTNAAVVDRFLA